MEIQQRILKFIIRANWVILITAGFLGLLLVSADFSLGIFCGGLLMNVNFHLLDRTLRAAFQETRTASAGAILAKYYLRFILSGTVIIFLLFGHIVDPFGLFIGLSVVVASIMLASIMEFSKLIFKEAA